MKRVFFRGMAALLAWSGGFALAQDAPWQQKAIALMSAEGRVVEARWNGPGDLWVSVADDGTSRAGFASYLCLVLAGEAGIPGGTTFGIKVLDVAGVAKGEMEVLGQWRCEANPG